MRSFRHELHQPGDPLFLPNARGFASAAQLVRTGYGTAASN
jgi:hypothetical protein